MLFGDSTIGSEVKSGMKISHSDFYYAPRLEHCYDGTNSATNLAPDSSYPIPIPGQARFKLQLKTAA